MARAKRAVSALSSASPNSGSFNLAASHQSLPLEVLMYIRKAMVAAVSADVTGSHHFLTMSLATNSILVGVGIFIVGSLKMVANRGTTNVSSRILDARPTAASNAGYTSEVMM